VAERAFPPRSKSGAPKPGVVEVYDLKGRRVFDSEVEGHTFTWNLQNNTGQQLSNGVYLYVVSTRGDDDKLVRMPIRKLVILR
jgi:flagellar hook assembly protein FlgD